MAGEGLAVDEGEDSGMFGGTGNIGGGRGLPPCAEEDEDEGERSRPS